MSKTCLVLALSAWGIPLLLFLADSVQFDPDQIVPWLWAALLGASLCLAVFVAICSTIFPLLRLLRPSQHNQLAKEKAVWAWDLVLSYGYLIVLSNSIYHS